MSSRDMRTVLNHHLHGVEKPARYTGGEFGSVVKDPGQVNVTVALAYPDVYEVGMSHLGSQILYHEINRRSDALAERVFSPWPDMGALLEKVGARLYALESGRPVGEFDLLGITLQYELTYTNILRLLSLSGIPLTTAGRDGAAADGRRVPVVIAGGPCAFNPEPLAGFLDAVVLGDGEEVIHDILDAAADLRPSSMPPGRARRALLDALASVDGVYVPSLYRVEYEDDGRVAEVIPVRRGVPERVRRRVVPDLDAVDYPVNPVVPFLDVVHDRAVVELFRGCSRGCRFCQASVLYRPVRERSPEEVLRLSRQVVDRTGYDELSLVSLSSTDYSALDRVSTALLSDMGPRGIGLSLPSLRVDSLSVAAARRMGQVRKTGLTLAPEAGTQRLRDVINKGVTGDDFRQAVTAAFEAGWDTLKLYFMVGLPTETGDDIDGIIDMVEECHRLQQPYRRRGRRRLRINVSVAGFVPKPHTPFQWSAQDEPRVLADKASRIKSALGGSARVSYGDPWASRVEAVLARGDRRLGAVIAGAFGNGARFDAWTEHFLYRTWARAMDDEGLDAGFFASRSRDRDEVFPWSHLDSGVTDDYLWREYQRALKGTLTPDCRWAACTDCGLCPAAGVAPRLAGTGE